MNRLTIIHGDALRSLRRLRRESVQCCVTSPPYWGLRDYGLAPLVWDGNRDCPHEWTAHVQPAANGQTTHAMIAKTLNMTSATRRPKLSWFCSRCGAWRGCLGLEPSPELFIQHLAQVFGEVSRVLMPNGTLWIVISDSYAASGAGKPKPEHKQFSNRGSYTLQGSRHAPGLKPKDLVGIPWMLAFALREQGWYLRSDIIWFKPNPMPESVRDRPTKAHEYIFLLAKSERYYYAQDAIRGTWKPESLQRLTRKWEGNEQRDHPGGAQNNIARYHGKSDEEIAALKGPNKRDVWVVTTRSYHGAHFATFPPELIRPCILAGASPRTLVLDPFGGSGTVAQVALEEKRRVVLIEPKRDYIDLIQERTKALSVKSKIIRTQSVTPYYEEKNITIYNADWREAMPSLKKDSVGMLCTDPPFGTTNLEWDKAVDWKLFWPCVERLCKAYAVMAMFSSGQFTPDLIATNRKNFRYELIWEKPMPVGFLSANRRPLRAHENILIFTRRYQQSVYNPQMIKGKVHVVGKTGTRPKHYGNFKRLPARLTDKWHPRSILRFSKPLGPRSVHPTQKPLELILWLIKSYSNPRHLVLDPFMGSGTALVAAKMCGRRAIGIETNEAYCEVAAQRLMGVR